MVMASEIAQKIRSQKTSVGFEPKARPNCFLRHTDLKAQRELKGVTAQIGLMGAVGRVEVLDQDAPDPTGTLRDVVNDKCTIFMEVQGLDLTREQEKLLKKVSNAEKVILSYEAKIAMPGYEDKVPAN